VDNVLAIRKGLTQDDEKRKQEVERLEGVQNGNGVQNSLDSSAITNGGTAAAAAVAV
jgi:hypothetical protein